MPLEYQESEIRDLFMGRRIVKVEQGDYNHWGSGFLTLDDGTELVVVPNEGGCVCSAGDYFIKSLATCDNVITNVKVLDTVTDDGWEEDHLYQIFVYTQHEQIAAVEIEGSDGNGYYGTGFWIGVKGQSRWG